MVIWGPGTAYPNRGSRMWTLAGVLGAAVFFLGGWISRGFFGVSERPYL